MGVDKNDKQRKQLKKQINLKAATYNYMTLLSEERLTEMEVELSSIIWVIVEISEVKRHGDSFQTLRSGNTFFHYGKVQASASTF